MSIDKHAFLCFFLKFFTIFSILLHSIFVKTVFEPGLVDSPPTSIMFAPALIIFKIWFLAFFCLLNFPPSEKLSGVKFKIPMIDGSKKFIFFRKFFLLRTIFFKSCLTFFLGEEFKVSIFLILMIFDRILLFLLVITSTLSKAIFLLPHNGKASFFLINSLALAP